jgi:hypothetical protein
MQIGLTEQVRKMFFNHRYLTCCVSHDDYEYPAVRFAQDLSEHLVTRR